MSLIEVKAALDAAWAKYETEVGEYAQSLVMVYVVPYMIAYQVDYVVDGNRWGFFEPSARPGVRPRDIPLTDAQGEYLACIVSVLDHRVQGRRCLASYSTSIKWSEIR